ncbi:MAG: pyruvate kinase [Firmicutes bacterium]|nr:pyruvate kinase [Bacillota bacterium]
MRKTKIVCTVGPASKDIRVLEKMIAAGMNVMRLNFSHGNHEEHKQHIEDLKALREKTGRHVAVMLDTKGPEIRTGSFPEPVQLEQGALFTLTPDEVPGDGKRCSVSYKSLARDVSPGSRIMIDDGLIEMKVEEIDGRDIRCRIVNSGMIGSHKGINLPGVRTHLQAVTEKDRADLVFGAENGVDFVAASFVRKAEDIRQIRQILDENGGEEIQIIAKLENQEGVENLEEILAEADGIMVARGDMGVELEPEKIPLIQKEIIRACNRAGKPVITATQMLDSMARNPRPTRAEVGDVTNAILDGTDCVMLSGETAAGEYPVEAVEMMHKIAETTEKSIDYAELLEKTREYQNDDVTGAIGYATCVTAVKLKAKAIVTASASGFAGRMVAKFRPKAPIIVSTTRESTARRMAVVRGAYPVIIPAHEDEETIFRESIAAAEKDADWIKEGDVVIFTAGFPFGKSGSTNMMKVHVI